jgi:hypothetical protein
LSSTIKGYKSNKTNELEDDTAEGSAVLLDIEETRDDDDETRSGLKFRQSKENGTMRVCS